MPLVDIRGYAERPRRLGAAPRVTLYSQNLHAGQCPLQVVTCMDYTGSLSRTLLFHVTIPGDDTKSPKRIAKNRSLIIG